MRKLLLIAIVLLFIAVAYQKPTHAQNNYCQIGCQAASDGYATGCYSACTANPNHGDCASQCSQAASEFYYNCLCSQCHVGSGC